MKVYIGGEPTVSNIQEFEEVVAEINAIVSDGFFIEQVMDSAESNYYIFFGSGNEYGILFPGSANVTASNWGLFTVFFNGQNELYAGHMYVDITRANDREQRHLIREELTQSLGLARDSPKYSDSMFQSSWTTVTEYADIDRELIRLLYHPQMRTGIGSATVDALIKDIYMDELNN
jgi:hypothetical protein